MSRELCLLLCGLSLLLGGCAQQRMNDQADTFLKSLQAPAPSPMMDQLQNLRAQAREQKTDTTPAPAPQEKTLIWHFNVGQQQPSAEQVRSFQAWYLQRPGALRLRLGPASADGEFAAAQAALARAQTLQTWLLERGLQAELSYQPQLPAHQLQWMNLGDDGA